MIQSQPLVTIGIPNYNYASYLHECISSVINQTYKNIEILISDNASTDNSVEVIKSFNDPRIRYWVNDENLGVYPNWDLLVKEAKGEYFKILQSDDYIEPTYVEECVENLIKFDAGSVFTGCRIIGINKPEIKLDEVNDNEIWIPTKEELSTKIISLTKFVHPTIGLYKKNIIEDEIVIIFTMSFNYNFYIALIASLYFNYLHYFWYINVSHEMV